jgi:hypothetical protein
VRLEEAERPSRPAKVDTAQIALFGRIYKLSRIDATARPPFRAAVEVAPGSSPKSSVRRDCPSVTGI